MNKSVGVKTKLGIRIIRADGTIERKQIDAVVKQVPIEKETKQK